MRLVAAPTRACTGRKLTFQRRLVTLWAWLMRFPACGFLPQISHCCAMITPEESCRAKFDFTGTLADSAILAVSGELRAILIPCSPRFKRPAQPLIPRR